jgi:hypothetical protein
MGGGRAKGAEVCQAVGRRGPTYYGRSGAGAVRRRGATSGPLLRSSATGESGGRGGLIRFAPSARPRSGNRAAREPASIVARQSPCSTFQAAAAGLMRRAISSPPSPRPPQSRTGSAPPARTAGCCRNTVKAQYHLSGDRARARSGCRWCGRMAQRGSAPAGSRSSGALRDSRLSNSPAWVIGRTAPSCVMIDDLRPAPDVGAAKRFPTPCWRKETIVPTQPVSLLHLLASMVFRL